MVDVKCSYCGTSFDFTKGLHKEFKDRDFRKYLHFCSQPHYTQYLEQLNQKSLAVAEHREPVVGHLGSIESELR